MDEVKDEKFKYYGSSLKNLKKKKEKEKTAKKRGWCFWGGNVHYVNNWCLLVFK